MSRWLPTVCLGAMFILPCGVLAHTPSESFSSWRYDKGVLSMRFTVSEREASRLPVESGRPAAATLEAYLPSHVEIDDQEAACKARGAPQRLTTRPGFVQIELAWDCAQRPRRFSVNTFFDLAAEHSHFATFEAEAGFYQKLLTAQDTVWLLPGKDLKPPDPSHKTHAFLDYVVLGFGHILSGLDHVLFLLGLLLLCRNFKELVWAITGFTLGHSLSLGLVTAGLLQANVAAIEATIGLTIALVAIERASNSLSSAWPLAVAAAALILLLLPLKWVSQAVLGAMGLFGLALFSACYLLGSHAMKQSGMFRLLITAFFGVIHGFGFAGAFQAASLGTRSVWLPLTGFNIGVELGQLLLVALLLLGARWFRVLSPRFTGAMADALAATICGFGVFWFIERSLY